MAADQTVRIVREGDRAKVYSPFEAKEAIKTLPRRWRTWDTDEKCWIVLDLGLDELKRALRAEGFTIIDRSNSGTGQSRSRRSADCWADSMYAALGRQLASKAYKALAPVLHPDRGGDTAAMQELNAARDRAAVK